MKTVIQIAAAYLQARARAEAAMERGALDYDTYREQQGKREAYADVLELNEETFTAPPAADQPLARVNVLPAYSYGRVVVCFPRVPDVSDPRAEVCWMLPTNQARELLAALGALDWPPNGGDAR